MPTNKAHALRARSAVNEMLDGFERNGPDGDAVEIYDEDALIAAREMLQGALALVNQTRRPSIVFKGAFEDELEEPIKRLNHIIKVLREEDNP